MVLGGDPCKHGLLELPQRYCLVDWLVVLTIYIDLVIFQLYCDLEADDNQFLIS